MTRILLLIAVMALAPVAAMAEDVVVGKGAVLRGIDRITGEVADIRVMNGDVVRMGRIMIALGECRYPSANPAGEAYAFLAIGEETTIDPIFQGWMVASSPALNAMDHRRYDVWVMRCITE